MFQNKGIRSRVAVLVKKLYLVHFSFKFLEHVIAAIDGALKFFIALFVHDQLKINSAQNIMIVLKIKSKNLFARPNCLCKNKYVLAIDECTGNTTKA